MSCGVGHICGSDPALLWLWLWLWLWPGATAPIRPLAWGPPYATGVALKRQKTKKKKKKKKDFVRCWSGGRAIHSWLYKMRRWTRDPGTASHLHRHPTSPRHDSQAHGDQKLFLQQILSIVEHQLHTGRRARCWDYRGQ